MRIDVNLIRDYLFPGIFFIVFGIGGIVGRSFQARLAVKWNKRIVGFAGKEQTYKTVSLLGGIAFIIFGVLILMGVVQFKE